MQEETRRHRQRTKGDQNKQTRDQGRRENWNQIPSPSEKTIQDRPEYEEEEELRRALEPKRQERKGTGRSHGEKPEEYDPDRAFGVAVSMEEYRMQLHVPRVEPRRNSEEDRQEALKRSRL